jgi:hypothetical protein
VVPAQAKKKGSCAERCSNYCSGKKADCNSLCMAKCK